MQQSIDNPLWLQLWCWFSSLSPNRLSRTCADVFRCITACGAFLCCWTERGLLCCLKPSGHDACNVKISSFRPGRRVLQADPCKLTLSLFPQVDVQEEEEEFQGLVTACLSTLILAVQTRLDAPLQQMCRMPWATMEVVSSLSTMRANQ